MKTLDAFARVNLAILPTPLYKLENLSRLLHTNLYIKRDDLNGVGLGGNKVRKLEYLLGDALQQKADIVMTTGGAQSNHAMLTAACALRLGLEPMLLLKKRGVCTRQGNQLLNWLMGAQVRFIDTDSYDDIYAEMERISEQKAQEGKRCYRIPTGGSVPLGSLGYVRCMQEVAQQAEQMQISFDHIICATGSGGTHAGTAIGAELYLPGATVTGMAVDTDPFERIVPQLMDGVNALLERPAKHTSVRLRHMYGPGYAIASPEGMEAIRLMAQHEGIFLDPVYTGKAFAGLLAMAREGAFGPEDHVLFLHTGGAGGLFAVELPEA